MECDVVFGTNKVSLHECGTDVKRFPYAIYKDCDDELHFCTGNAIVNDWHFIARCDSKETAMQYMNCLETKPGPWHIYEDMTKNSRVFAIEDSVDCVSQSYYILRYIVFDYEEAKAIVNNNNKHVYNIVYDKLTVFKWLSEGKTILRRLCHPGISNAEMGNEGWESYDPEEDLFSEDFEYMKEDELWPANMNITFDAEFKTKKELEEFLEKIKEVAVQDTVNVVRTYKWRP